MFSSELLENPTLLKASALSRADDLPRDDVRPLQRILDTVELSVDQWAICIVVAASIIVVAEVRKIFRRRRPVAQPAAPKVALEGQPS